MMSASTRSRPSVATSPMPSRPSSIVGSEVRRALGGELAVLVDDVRRLDERVHALLENSFLLLEHLGVLDGGEPAHHPRLHTTSASMCHARGPPPSPGLPRW